MNCPTFHIDVQDFWHDPYPALAQMRFDAPICYVPELNATLMTKRNDIFHCEKVTDVFSSDQPGGLMTVLMGQNMMRKVGREHINERQQMQPAVSPRTVKTVWMQQFQTSTDKVLSELAERDTCDLVADYAMPVSAHALRYITGLINMTPTEMDSASQGMIDGIANYSGNEDVEQRCNNATSLIDNRIEDMLLSRSSLPEKSILNVLVNAGQPMDAIRANIKLAISGGQNEPRDAIAGTAWALLKHPEQLQSVLQNDTNFLQAFEEYARWLSPIGMSPRRIAKAHAYEGVTFEPESRLFFMFSSGNRDEGIFDESDQFIVSRDTSKAISFGAGPHFCAGAAISRTLIGEVALPSLFRKFPHLSLNGDTPFGGWAFRGPLSMPVNLR